MVFFFIVGKGLVPFLMFVGCFGLEERDKPFPYGFICYAPQIGLISLSNRFFMLSVEMPVI